MQRLGPFAGNHTGAAVHRYCLVPSFQLADTMLQMVQAMTAITKARRARAVLRFLRRCSGVMTFISLPEVFQRYGKAPARARTIPDPWRLPTPGRGPARRSCALP